MKIKKTDQRSRFTQTVIRKSLLKLLSEKPLKDVTVSELCIEAEVNRGTFYNHFPNVYDVYESIESQFFEEVKKRLDLNKMYELDYSFFRELLLFVSENSDFMTVMAADFGERSLLKKLVSFVRDKYVAEFAEHYPKLQSQLVEAVFTYSVNGSIGLVLEWIRQGKKQNADEIAEYIENFSKAIMKEFLN